MTNNASQASSVSERLRAYRGGTTEWRALMDEAADTIQSLEAERDALRERAGAVLAQIDADEAAMLEERKAQYGPAFRSEQEAAIKNLHKQRRIGAEMVLAALKDASGEVG